MRKIDPVKHEEKRQEILEAAGRCFARKGFQGATISDICSEAKISPGHLYHYFASKEAIVSAMAEARITQVGARFEHVMESSDPIGAFHEPCVRCWPLSSGKRRKAGRSIAAST